MSNITIDADADSNGIRSDILGTWAAVRVDDPAKELTVYVVQASTGFQCGRYFAFFDMTGIAAGSTINSAKIVHPQAGNHASAGGGSVHIVEHVATDPVGVDDFLNYKSLDADTSFGSETYANISTVGTTDIAINASGITYLTSVIGGVAKIGLRSSFDKDNSAPAGNSQYTCSVTAFDLYVDYTLLTTTTTTTTTTSTSSTSTSTSTTVTSSSTSSSTSTTVTSSSTSSSTSTTVTSSTTSTSTTSTSTSTSSTTTLGPPVKVYSRGEFIPEESFRGGSILADIPFVGDIYKPR